MARDSYHISNARKYFFATSSRPRVETTSPAKLTIIKNGPSHSMEIEI